MKRFPVLPLLLLLAAAAAAADIPENLAYEAPLPAYAALEKQSAAFVAKLRAAPDDTERSVAAESFLSYLAGVESKLSAAGKADYASEPDLLDYQLRILWDIRHERVRTVDTLGPLVSFDFDFNVGLHVAGQVLAGPDGLDRPAYGRMDECRHEAAGFGDRLADLYLVPDSHHGLRGSAYVL